MKQLHYLLLLTALLLVSELHVFAQTAFQDADSLGLYLSSITDTAYVSAKQKVPSIRATRKLLTQAQAQHDLVTEAHALLSLGDAYIAYGNNKKAIEYLIDALKLKDTLSDNTAIAHLYYDLAIVLSRLKKYSAALQCFYKTGYVYQQTYFKRKRKQVFAVDTTASHIASLLDSNFIISNEAATIFTDEIVDSALFSIDTAKLINNPVAEESTPVDYNDIIDAFYDGKPAFAYGILFHVKQPVPGRKNIFTQLSKVGHTFITLIKFNADSTIISKTFGFYPEKDNLLSGTPLMPSTNSTIKDDALHDWDELIGRFISAKKFESILDFVDAAGNNRYNLNKNNCTDFALRIAALANITIEETKGRWPLGHGNNPALTGQSILLGKFKNAVSQNKHGLFACSNNLFIKRSSVK